VCWLKVQSLGLGTLGFVSFELGIFGVLELGLLDVCSFGCLSLGLLEIWSFGVLEFRFRLHNSEISIAQSSGVLVVVSEIAAWSVGVWACLSFGVVHCRIHDAQLCMC
jgi:hypothetical protein